jgi:hypothetical protein
MAVTQRDDGCELQKRRVGALDVAGKVVGHLRVSSGRAGLRPSMANPVSMAVDDRRDERFPRRYAIAFAILAVALIGGGFALWVPASGSPCWAAAWR